MTKLLNEESELEGLEDVLKEVRESKQFLFKANEADKEEQEQGESNEVLVDNGKLTNTKSEPLTKDGIFKIRNKEEALEAIKYNSLLSYIKGGKIMTIENIKLHSIDLVRQFDARTEAIGALFAKRTAQLTKVLT